MQTTSRGGWRRIIPSSMSVATGGLRMNAFWIAANSLKPPGCKWKILQSAFRISVQFRFGFTLGRFHHQSAGHRPRHGRRMEAEILKALCNIFHLHPGGFNEFAAIQNAFMRNPPVATDIEDGIIRRQPPRDV